MEKAEQFSVISDDTDSEIDDLLGTSSDSTFTEVNPILDVIKGQGYPGGPIIATFDFKSKERISEYLKMSEVNSLLT
jgi:SecD/SecF fusion protein